MKLWKNLDKQYGFSIIVILLGFGLIQIDSDDSFLMGAGVGTISIGIIWLVLQIVRALKNPTSKLKK